MFLVLNKKKITSYLVSLSTVAILFTFCLTNNSKNESIQTSVNVQINNHINEEVNSINCTKNEENISNLY